MTNKQAYRCGKDVDDPGSWLRGCDNGREAVFDGAIAELPIGIGTPCQKLPTEADPFADVQQNVGTRHFAARAQYDRET